MYDFGITRTIDHAVYVMLNALAAGLWRLNAALLGMSMLSYGTQDWLTGSPNSGIWQLSQYITQELLNQNTWKLFLLTALLLFGASLMVCPFVPSFRPVDLGRLFFFAALSYSFITQGMTIMRDMETLRAQAGDYIYQAMSTGGQVTISVPGGTPNQPNNLSSTITQTVSFRGASDEKSLQRSLANSRFGDFSLRSK